MKTAKLRKTASGQIQALSSNQRDIYIVNIGTQQSCTCLGFQHHGYCYHVSSAIQRFTAFWPLPQQAPLTEVAELATIYGE